MSRPPDRRVVRGHPESPCAVHQEALDYTILKCDGEFGGPLSKWVDDIDARHEGAVDWHQASVRDAISYQLKRSVPVMDTPDRASKFLRRFSHGERFHKMSLCCRAGTVKVQATAVAVRNLPMASVVSSRSKLH